MPDTVYLDDFDSNVHIPEQKRAAVFEPGKWSDLNCYDLKMAAVGMLRDIESIVKGNLNIIQQLLEEKTSENNHLRLLKLKSRMEQLAEFFSRCSTKTIPYDFKLIHAGDKLENVVDLIILYGNDLKSVYSQLAVSCVVGDNELIFVNDEQLAFLLKDFLSLFNLVKTLKEKKDTALPLVLSTPLKTDLYNGNIFSNRTAWAVEKWNVKVPRKIHEVWVGSKLPSKYFENLLSLRKMNYQHEMSLWSFDPQVLSKAIAAAHYDLPQVHLIKVRDIQKELYPLIDKHFPELIAKKIIQIIEVESAGAKNLAAVSDIVRLVVLYLEGGWYLDSDFYAAPSNSRFSQDGLTKVRHLFEDHPAKYKAFMHSYDVDFHPAKRTALQYYSIKEASAEMKHEGDKFKLNQYLAQGSKQLQMLQQRHYRVGESKKERCVRVGWGHINANNCYIYSSPKHPLTYKAILNLLINYQHLADRKLASALPVLREKSVGDLPVQCSRNLAKFSMFSMLDVKRLAKKPIITDEELKKIPVEANAYDQHPSRLNLTIFSGVAAVTSVSEAITDYNLKQKVVLSTYNKVDNGIFTNRIRYSHDANWLKKNKATAAYSYDTLDLPKMRTTLRGL